MSYCKYSTISDFTMVLRDSEEIAFNEIPLTALSKKTLEKLSQLLNTIKIFRSEEGYERNWRGLASLVIQNFSSDESSIFGEDPTAKVIQLWYTNNPKTATFGHLEHYLGTIERWDICDNIYQNLLEDKQIFQTKYKKSTNSNLEDEFETKTTNLFNDIGKETNPNILTTSDVKRAQMGLPPQMYDAFVLYADTDINYAAEIKTKLEDNPEYNIKLCMKDRDLLGGIQFEHVALTKLIEERCKHLIVILTQEFLKSFENKFLVNYMQAQQIEINTGKIVPLLYEENVDVPKYLNIYNHLCYKPNTASFYNFWFNLANSIQNLSNNTTEIMTFSHGSTHKIKSIVKQPAKIPSICISYSDETEKSQKKEISKLKSLTMPSLNTLNDDIIRHSAVSTKILNTACHNKIAASMCDLPTTSTKSTEIKKKKKWSRRILKKVFSSSSVKL